MRIAICDDNPQDIERIKRYQTVVEYSLAGYQNPIGVAEWKNQIVQALPEELKRNWSKKCHRLWHNYERYKTEVNDR